MKSTLFKLSAALAVLLTSAGAMAATTSCCGGLDCCLEMLACCFN